MQTLPQGKPGDADIPAPGEAETNHEIRVNSRNEPFIRLKTGTKIPTANLASRRKLVFFRRTQDHAARTRPFPPSTRSASFMHARALAAAAPLCGSVTMLIKARKGKTSCG
jgi:hypothetical protein